MRYRKKPVVIEAVQYDGNFRCLDIFSINDVGKFIIGTDDAGNPCLKIPTLEGVMIASKGDYVIRGIKGEYYPCKPDVFEMTYERDEPTIIQAPIKNYDAWDEVIDQLGDSNKMIDHVPDVGKMVEDVEKLAEEFYPLNDDLYPNSSLIRKAFTAGYNTVKETLYTEEQVMEGMLQISEYYADNFGKDIDGHKKALEIIQSLKQPKQ
jgi:hypothetical protein